MTSEARQFSKRSEARFPMSNAVIKTVAANQELVAKTYSPCSPPGTPPGNSTVKTAA